MDYEKKYKKALEKCRELYYGAKDRGETYEPERFESIFPELKEESDDEHFERILKELENQCQNPINRPYLDKIESDYTWLKSLRHQKRLKSGDEHYELEEFAKIVRGNLTGINKAVQKLFEDKYLQLTGNKMYGGFKD